MHYNGYAMLPTTTELTPFGIALSKLYTSRQVENGEEGRKFIFLNRKLFVNNSGKFFDSSFGFVLKLFIPKGQLSVYFKVTLHKLAMVLVGR